VLRIFRPEKSASLGTKGQHATSRPPKPLCIGLCLKKDMFKQEFLKTLKQYFIMLRDPLIYYNSSTPFSAHLIGYLRNCTQYEIFSTHSLNLSYVLGFLPKKCQSWKRGFLCQYRDNLIPLKHIFHHFLYFCPLAYPEGGLGVQPPPPQIIPKF
jgi:hypothetical protein